MRLRVWRPLGTATAAFAHILAVVEVDLVVLSKEVQAGQVSRDTRLVFRLASLFRH
jgi:hypothetical protein